MKRKLGRGVWINSVLLALYLDIPALNLILSGAFPSLAGKLMSVAYLACVVGIFTVLLFTISFRRIRIRPGFWVVLGSITAAYGLTLFTPSLSSLSPVHYAVYVAAALLITYFIQIDVATFLKAVFVLPFLGIAFLDSTFVVNEINVNITMGVSYAFLVPVTGAVTYLFGYMKNERGWGKLFTVACLLINGVYLVYLVQYGSRGPLLSTVLCVAFLLGTNAPSPTQRGVRFKGVKVIVWLAVLVLAVVFFWDIIDLLVELSEALDIDLRFLAKLQKLNLRGDVLNGRDEIFEAAVAGIKDRPLFGHGIASFWYHARIIYPHNFVLQLLYDGGAVLFGLVMVPVLFGLVRWLRRCAKDDYLLMTMLLFTAVPGALFSGDLWEKAILWITFGFLLSRRYTEKPE